MPTRKHLYGGLPAAPPAARLQTQPRTFISLRILDRIADFVNLAVDDGVRNWLRVSGVFHDLVFVELQLLLFNLDLPVEHLTFSLQESELFGLG